MHSRVSVSPMALLAYPVADEVQLLGELGAGNVGLSTQKLAAEGWDEAVGLVRSAGLDVTYLVHPVTTAVDDVAGWDGEQAVLLRAVRTAADVGARFVYFPSGPPGTLPWEEAVDALGQRLAPVAVEARRAGVRLAVEHTHTLRGDISFLFSLRAATVAARACGIGVVFDCFASWIEPDLHRTLDEEMDLIELVQVSDHVIGRLDQPNRWVPGDGDLPLRRLLAGTVASGYPHTFDIELLGPQIEGEGAPQALRRAAAWLASTLQELGVPDRPRAPAKPDGDDSGAAGQMR